MKWLIERRLRSLTDSVRRAREELVVMDEQIIHFSEEADYAHTKSMVADSPEADRASFEAKRSAETMIKARADLARRLETMRADQDKLLDQLGSQ
jgi:cell division septum initiation protein DivIVA